MLTLNTFEMIVVCLGSGAVGACAALLASIDKATARDTRTMRASLQDLAAAALEDGEYIEELEEDVLELTNETMELQESLQDLATAALEDGDYIEELEEDVLRLTNETMELQESLHDIRAVLSATLEHFFAGEFNSEEE